VSIAPLLPTHHELTHWCSPSFLFLHELTPFFSPSLLRKEGEDSEEQGIAPSLRSRESLPRAERGGMGHSRQPKESEQDFTGRIINGKLILTLKFS